MQYTTNYNLITVEGTDVVNPLVQMNPNFTDIDAAMFANKQASIGTATEIAAGNVHSITRTNTDSNYFKFTATSNWTTGDSMSIDGVNVSVFLTDGTVPVTGAYVINSEVFGILAGTRVTLFLTNPITSLAASDVTYNGDTVETALNNIDSEITGIETTSNVTITDIMTPLALGRVTAYKRNKVVTLIINGLGYSSNITTDTGIFSVSDAPHGANVRFVLFMTGNVPVTGYVHIDGRVIINGVDANKYLYGSVTYICD